MAFEITGAINNGNPVERGVNFTIPVQEVVGFAEVRIEQGFVDIPVTVVALSNTLITARIDTDLGADQPIVICVLRPEVLSNNTDPNVLDILIPELGDIEDCDNVLFLNGNVQPPVQQGNLGLFPGEKDIVLQDGETRAILLNRAIPHGMYVAPTDAAKIEYTFSKHEDIVNDTAVWFDPFGGDRAGIDHDDMDYPISGVRMTAIGGEARMRVERRLNKHTGYTRYIR